MFTISIRANTLTDGSKTHDVLLRDQETQAVLEFHAVCEEDANSFMDHLDMLVQTYTNDEVVTP